MTVKEFCWSGYASGYFFGRNIWKMASMMLISMGELKFRVYNGALWAFL